MPIGLPEKAWALRTIAGHRRGIAAGKRRGRMGSGSGQLSVEPAEDAQGRAAPAKGELEASAGANQPGGQVHQLLHDGAQASALGLVTHRGVGTEQGAQANPAQDVVGKLGAGQHQGIGGELAGRQTFDVEVGLELAVELLGGAVIGVQGDNVLGIGPQTGPPAFDLDLGDQQLLAVLVDGALDDAHDAAKQHTHSRHARGQR